MHAMTNEETVSKLRSRSSNERLLNTPRTHLSPRQFNLLRLTGGAPRPVRGRTRLDTPEQKENNSPGSPRVLQKVARNGSVVKFAQGFRVKKIIKRRNSRMLLGLTPGVIHGTRPNELTHRSSTLSAGMISRAVAVWRELFVRTALHAID